MTATFLHQRKDFKNLIVILERETGILPTLIEKLQTITAKFRTEQAVQEAQNGAAKVNFMRQYYDVYQLLQLQEIEDFTGTEEYKAHKADHFRGKDLEIPISENDAFRLTGTALREEIKTRYQSTAPLYYKGQPDFDEMVSFIGGFLRKLD